MLGLEVQNIFEYLNQTEKKTTRSHIRRLVDENTKHEITMYLELFVVLESENDPLESVAETFISNPATY